MSIRWDKDSQTYWLPKADRSLELMLDQEHERVPGELRWKRRTGVIALAAKAVELVRTITSGDVDADILAKRQAACDSCSALVRAEGNKYCGACGCGKWLLAALDGPSPKLRYVGTRCPLGRF